MKKLYLAYSLVFVILHLHSSHANPRFGGGLSEGICKGKFCSSLSSGSSEPWPTTTTKKPVYIVDVDVDDEYHTEAVEEVTLGKLHFLLVKNTVFNSFDRHFRVSKQQLMNKKRLMSQLPGRIGHGFLYNVCRVIHE